MSNAPKIRKLRLRISEKVFRHAAPLADPVSFARELDLALGREFTRIQSRIPVRTTNLKRKPKPGWLKRTLTNRRHTGRKVVVHPPRSFTVRIRHPGAVFRPEVVPKPDSGRVVLTASLALRTKSSTNRLRALFRRGRIT